MSLEFAAELWTWRGPAPFYFVTVPDEHCQDLKAAAKFVTYGWGMIPVRARIGETTWKTSLFPKNDRYLVPIKASIRKAEKLEEGDHITVSLEIG